MSFLFTAIPNGRRRRLYIPPSTQYPLFSYGEGDQRSFLSLEEGSVADLSDAASVSTSRSLPSTLSSVTTTEDQESFHSWLEEEHQRRIGSTQNSEEEESDVASEHSKAHSVPDFAGMKTTVRSEAWLLLYTSLPLIFMLVVEHLFSVVCLVVVGRLGTDELAAVSLGTMVTTVTFAVFEGIATALDSLCPQAYGAQNYELVSLHVQRCTVFSMMLFVPCSLLWWHSKLYLQYVVDSDKVLELTSLFLRVMVAGAPSYIFFENSKRFLQAQGDFRGGGYIITSSCMVNIVLSAWLVWSPSMGLGFVGAPIATVATYWYMSVCLVFYVAYGKTRKCWFGLAHTRDLFSSWGTLSSLAIPGVVMLESEYLAYEIMTLFATYFGTTALAAQSTVSTIASLTYMVPFAVSIAVSIRVGVFIGGANIPSAKNATYAGLIVGTGVATLNCIMLFSFKTQIAALFSKDPDVQALIVDLLNPLVAIIQIFDGVASVAGGILRAQGAHKIGGTINFLCYYAFALPMALVLSKIANLELVGLWLGVGCGMALIGVSSTAVVLWSDWEEILHQGMMRE